MTRRCTRLVKGNIAVFALEAGCELFGVMHIHSIGKAVVSFPHFFSFVPSVGFIGGLPATTWRDPRTLACLMKPAEVFFGEGQTFARRLTLAMRGLWRHLLLQ